MMDSDTDPAPPWPDAPRHSTLPFPSFRYLRSQPRPSASNIKSLTNLSSDNWRENESYLYGIDLYHAAYFWEAHECWEELWKREDKKSRSGLFLQGLILNTAAQFKSLLQNYEGLRNLSKSAIIKLEDVIKLAPSKQMDTFMGIGVKELVSKMEGYYQPLWDGGTAGHGDKPRLELS